MTDPVSSATGAAASSPPDEAARFAFDCDLEKRKLDLEERKLAQSRTDTWTRFWSTIFVSGVLTLGLSVYARWVDGQAEERANKAAAAAKERAERAQQAQVAIELVNARERASADLRAQMFTALLQNYFRDASDLERIAILQLIALNFRDAVQIRPMLELLDNRLRSLPTSANKADLMKELRRASRIIIRDQLDQIRQAREGDVSRLGLRVGDSGSPGCLPALRITLDRIQDESSILVTTNSVDGELREANNDSPFRQFDVSYYDMPMTDYKTVKLPGTDFRVRYSIAIDSLPAGQNSAEIYVACLPSSPIGAERRYAFDELLEQYLYTH